MNYLIEIELPTGSTLTVNVAVTPTVCGTTLIQVDALGYASRRKALNAARKAFGGIARVVCTYPSMRKYGTPELIPVEWI